MSATPWQVLGIEPSADVSAIRRAYARQLKAIDPEVDPAAFIALREAREWALDVARSGDDLAVVAVEPASIAEPAPADLPDPVPLAQAPPEPEPDLEAIERLRAMIFEPGDMSDGDAIARQAGTVLSSPAMLNIDHSSRVEAFLFDLIVEGTPRSDPVIDPAIAHFRWDAAGNELHRPPVVDWILRRREDRYFELGLESRSHLHAALLARLRGGVPSRLAKFTAWRLGPRMEYFLAYLEQNHPTTLAGLNRETLSWWKEQVAAQHTVPRVLRWLPAWRRSMAWEQGIDGADRGRNVGLYLLIFLLPYAAVWLLLRAHHSWKERVVGFGYLALWLTLLLMPTHPAPNPNRVTSSAPPITTAPPAPIRFSDFSADLAPVLAAATSNLVTPVQLAERNPALNARLRIDWQRARDAGDWRDFPTAVFDRLGQTLDGALHGKDVDLIKDHARAYAARLRWAARGTMEECDDILHGRPGTAMLTDFKDYHAKLIGRAALSGVEPRAKRPLGTRFTVPPAVFSDAQRRSRLGASQFKASILDRGTPASRCVAQIALIDAAVEGGDEGTALLREMF